MENLKKIRHLCGGISTQKIYGEKWIKKKEEEIDEDDINDFPHMENDGEGFYSCTCECGGTIMPMDDRHPFWIVFCRECDRRWENSNSSPLPF